MFYFFYHLYEAGNLELCRPVVLFYGGEEPRKKNDWLDDFGGRPTSFRNDLTKDSVKNYSFKVKLFKHIQVYPEDFLRVVMHQFRRLTQSFLNTQERSKLLGDGRPEFCFGGVASILLTTKWYLLEERSLKGLKGHYKLSIKVNVAPQIVRQV